MRLSIAVGLSVVVSLASFSTAAQTADVPIYVQVWLGALDPQSDSWKITEPQSGSDVAGDLGTLPFGGGAGQQLWGSGAWQLGYEGGGLVSWKNDRTEFRGNNGSLRVKFDNTFALFGVFMGGVVSVRPVQMLRLYAAAGPSVTWAWVESDDDHATSTSGTVVNSGSSDNDVSFAPYARVGLEFVTSDAFTFGVSVRYADDEFHLGNDGDLKFDQPLWLLTLGARL